LASPARSVCLVWDAHRCAYSTEFCHPVRRKVATQSTAKLPRNPQESCHPVHGNSATQCTTALPLSERSDAGGVHDEPEHAPLVKRCDLDACLSRFLAAVEGSLAHLCGEEPLHHISMLSPARAGDHDGWPPQPSHHWSPLGVQRRLGSVRYSESA
jgi:hypothetical protein